jgi:hypothetical protein
LTPTHSTRDFDNAAFLLSEAADHVAQAARLLTKAASRAPHITKDMSRQDPSWQQMLHVKVDPSKLSMQELTEMATKLGGHRDQLAAYSAWFGSDDEGAHS